MFEVEETDKEPGIVVQVLQPGYAIDDRILRPAMVGVAAAKGGKRKMWELILSMFETHKTIENLSDVRWPVSYGPWSFQK